MGYLLTTIFNNRTNFQINVHNTHADSSRRQQGSVSGRE